MNVKRFYDQESRKYSKKFSSGSLEKFVRNKKLKCIELLDPKEGEHILDAGCGVGIDCLTIKKFGAIPFGIDFSEKMVQEANNKGVDAVVADLEDFNLDRKFDKILSIGALEFCKDQSKVLSNLRAHLKNEGYMVLLVPRVALINILYFLYHLKHGILIKLFRLKEFNGIVQKNGLKIDESYKFSNSYIVKVSFA